MENSTFKHIARFVIFIAVQVLVINHISISGYINPYIYIMFILLLPFDTKGWVLLAGSFALGLGIDMFSNSLGMHASACLFLAFFRPAVIRLISVKTDFDAGAEPRINNMGTGWIFLYTLILVFIHHFSLFLLEVFRFDEFLQTLGKTLLSASFSIILIMLIHFLISKPQKSGGYFK
jgi:hypothetical protein